LTRFAFDWVDAFTDRAFGGNGCVVVHQAEGLSIADRLALVRETSLSECAFVVGSDVADFGARYYLADKEILMAGHPTVATVASLVDRGLVTLEDGRAEFTLEVGAGVLPITVERRDGRLNVVMTQAAPQFGRAFDPAEIAAMVSLAPEDILGAPQVVSTGSPFCITVLEDKEALRRARLDVDLFYAMNPPGTPRAEVIEPFLVTLGGETEAGDTFSRLLLPPPMPAEVSLYRFGHRLHGRISVASQPDRRADLQGGAGPLDGPSRPGRGRGSGPPRGPHRRQGRWPGICADARRAGAAGGLIRAAARTTGPR